MHVHLNCAISLDGRLADRDGSPIPLSCDADMARVHVLRQRVDAILIGIGTALADDPSLRVKSKWLDVAGIDADPAHPVRVVLDPRGRLPADARLRDESVRTLLLHAESVQVDEEGVEAVPLPCGPEGFALSEVLGALANRGLESVLVEGGGKVLRAFFDAGAFESFTVYQSRTYVGGGPSLWLGEPPAPPESAELVTAVPLGEGVLLELGRRA